MPTRKMGGQAADDPDTMATMPVNLVAGGDATMPTMTLTGQGQPGQPVPQEIPERVSHYKVVGKLGEGGMGLVLEAVHEELGRPVALKLLKPDLANDSEFVERFLREAQSGGLVDHPNVVTIHDAGRDGDQLFMACQLVRGTDMGVLLRQKSTLTEAKACTYLIEACKGLQALHQAGLVHRDIKPGNIFLGDDGSVIVGDLGLARHADGDDRMTVTGTAMGTPAYMSPEHVQGIADLDIRTDVYALGATLYRMVTGQEPYPGDTLFVVTHKILTEPLVDPRRHNPSISAEVASIIIKAMAKDRDERYAEPKDLQADLECVVAGKPLMGAFVQRDQEVPLVRDWSDDVREDQLKQRSAPPPRRADGTGLLGLWSAVPPGLRRILLFAVLIGAAGYVLSRMPDWLTSQVAKDPLLNQPIWASDVSRDQYGPLAVLPIGSTSMAMRWCPPGQMTLGSPPMERDRSESEHMLPVAFGAGFWICETEVTQAQVIALLGPGANPSRFVEVDGMASGRLPVDSITWDQAQAFCQALAALHADSDIRLPTEAEWEYACRAGTTGSFAVMDEDRDLPGWHAGDELIAAYREGLANEFSQFREVDNLLAEHTGESGYTTREVAGLKANAWGLRDMHGNVAEWCLDAAERDAPMVAPPDHATGGSLRILRGGSWAEPPFWCRSASRAFEEPDTMDPSIGFRFVIVSAESAEGAP